MDANAGLPWMWSSKAELPMPPCSMYSPLPPAGGTGCPGWMVVSNSSRLEPWSPWSYMLETLVTVRVMGPLVVLKARMNAP